MGFHKYVEEQLFSELSRARDEYNRARKFLLQLTSEAPSGLPDPDSEARIQVAARRNAMALEAYEHALQECYEFMLHGSIPKRLRERL
jgi:hypothetical protein